MVSNKHGCGVTVGVGVLPKKRTPHRPYLFPQSYSKKGKGFPYSLTSVGPGADPGVQADSPQVTISHPPDGRLPLLSARPAVSFPAAEHHHPLADTKLYCLVTEAHRCEQLAQGCYAALPRVRIEPTTWWSQVPRNRLNHGYAVFYLLQDAATSDPRRSYSAHGEMRRKCKVYSKS